MTAKLSSLRPGLGAICGLVAALLLAAIVATPATASVVPRVAGLEDGSFAEFDQANASKGSLTNTSERAYEGVRSAKAAYTASGSGAGYARGIFEVGWQPGEQVHYGAAFYLPAGFKAAMQGQVDLMRWDNWSIDPTNTDRGGIVIYGSDKGARLVRARIGSAGEQVSLVGPFEIPEGRWVWIEVRQVLSPINGQALSEVWIDGTKVGSSTLANSYGRDVTRLRYGIVAVNDNTQTNPLTAYFDRTRLASGYVGPLAGSETRKSSTTTTTTKGRPRR